MSQSSSHSEGTNEETGRKSARQQVERALKRAEPLAGGYLFWSVTARCPNECGFCGQEKLFSENHRIVEFEVFSRVVTEAAAQGMRELVFTGGEPTLHPDLERFIKTARSHGLQVSVATSGAGGRRTALRILAGNPGRIALSIDCAEAAVHDRMRGRTGAFREALAMLELISGTKNSDLCLVTVVTRDNIERLEGMVELARRYGVSHLAFSLVLDPWGLSKSALRPQRMKLDRVFRETLPRLIEEAQPEVTVRPTPVPVGASELFWRNEVTALAQYLRSSKLVSREVELWSRGLYNVAFRRRYGCVLPLRDVMIAPNGDVYPCSSPTALRPENRLGNIYTESLESLRRGARAQAFFRTVDEHSCCATCQALSNASDGSYLVLRYPELVPQGLWELLAGQREGVE